jgi:hypothetical protein
MIKFDGTTEELQDRALILFQEATTRDPESTEIGIIVSERPGTPSPQYISLWFSDFDQLSQFILNSIPFSFCGVQKCDDIDPRFMELFHEINSIGIDAKTRLKSIMLLNQFFLEGIAIEWAGNFDELCSGSSQTAKQLIKWFRSDRDDAPITAPERRAFKEFLLNELPE